MKARGNRLTGTFKAALNACICAICSLALAASLTPAYALESTEGSPDERSGEPLVAESDPESSTGRHLSDDGEFELNDLERFELDGVQASNTMSLMSEDEDSAVRLKDTNETRWYDRVDFPSHLQSSCDNFYRTLVQASNNDGVNDYLIEDKYIDPSFNTANVPNEYENFPGGYSGIVIGSFKFLDNGGSYTTNPDYLEKKAELDDAALAVVAAFDRDHPEVFWLNSYTLTFYMTSTKPNAEGYRTSIKYLLIGGFQNLDPTLDKKNIRSISFGSEDSIKAAIDLRDERTKELLAKVGVDYTPGQGQINPDQPMEEDSVMVEYSDAEKVRYFNEWLTHANAYNTQDLSGLVNRCPLAFECLSALAGRTGRVGPVCEAYSRAFKVLCDAAGIPCVLVDGLGEGEAHMWNSVMIEGKWYAVDVTWNDPGRGTIARSGYENEDYFLIGAQSAPRRYPYDLTFGESHIVQNRHFVNGLEFTNGPLLEDESYDLSFANDAFVETDTTTLPPIDLSMLDRDVGLARITAIPDHVYTTNPITPVPERVWIGDTTLEYGKDYTIVYSDNVQAGNAFVRIIGIGSYAGTNSTSFVIKKASISVTSVTVKNMVYTGSALTPAPVVTVGNSNFRQGVDYVVETSYANNKGAGKGTVAVTVRGIGSCEGAVLRVLDFKISPKKLPIKKLTSAKKTLTVKWTKAKSEWCTGYQIRYSTSSKFKSGVKNIFVSKVSTSSRTIKKLKRKKRYYVSLRVYKTVGGVRYYGEWSATKSIKTR